MTRLAFPTALLTLAACSQRAPWRDPSPHRAQFVAVDENVRLEVLDWGGSGRPLVLLAGGGDTAHVFDDFAPKLAREYHVYGITRRGFGASSVPDSGYGADRLGDDVLAVLDSLQLARPVLAGHSLAGEELSSVGTRRPDRVAGLIYLDAGYQYAFDNGKGTTLEEHQKNVGPQMPAPGESDLASFKALRAYYARRDGFAIPEAEYRQGWESTPDGRVGKRRDFPFAIMKGFKKYTEITVPALVIFAIPHDQGAWVNHSTDPAVREAAKAYTAADVILTERQAKAFEDGVPSARVVRLPAHHYVFLSKEADVLREMRTFLDGLR
jgi:pimeloyl-ACP methyl ester carboxylesterase